MKKRRVTVNLPAPLLENAMAATGKGSTNTLIEGLQRVVKASAYYRFKRLRG